MRWTDDEYQALMDRRGRVKHKSTVCDSAQVRDLHETKEFMPAVIALAKRCGWKVYHTYDSRNSESGFVDLVMARKGKAIFAELKSAKGVVTPAQNDWLLALAGQSYVWRPGEWFDGTIEEILR